MKRLLMFLILVIAASQFSCGIRDLLGRREVSIYDIEVLP